MGASAQVKGAQEFASGLQEAAAGLQHLDAGNDEAGALIGRASRIPHRTGRLAASGQFGGSGTEVVGWAAPYAGVTHWGWAERNIRPQPFASDAITATSTELETAYTNAAQDVLDDVKGA